jgi:hypothetical protein
MASAGWQPTISPIDVSATSMSTSLRSDTPNLSALGSRPDSMATNQLTRDSHQCTDSSKKGIDAPILNLALDHYQECPPGGGGGKE